MLRFNIQRLLSATKKPTATATTTKSTTTAVAVKPSESESLPAPMDDNLEALEVTRVRSASSTAPAQIIPANADQLPDAYTTSGVPEEMLTRKARIYRPSRTAMQSGENETRYWQIDFDPLQKWENPLMGWSSR
jgi:hypothetical protein